MKKFIYCLTLLCSINAYATSPDNIVFLNSGKMNIAPKSGNDTSLYIVDAMIVTSSGVDIYADGLLKLGGNFYQNSETNVFNTDANGIGTSTGKIIFADNRGVNREISSPNTNFDRNAYYIAFPHIVIGTNDSIAVPAKMGIDANSIKRGNGKNGFMVLRSEPIGTTEVDASLRIPTTGSNSAALADLGAVIIEKDVSLYRNGEHIFGFATPFDNTQYSGYFAGNWVRSPQADANFHTTYVLGNKPSANNASVIDLDQYVIDPYDKLTTSQAYLIKPRPNGYDYTQIQDNGGLYITGADASAYDKGKFIFNGDVYYLTTYEEQLFADDMLFSHTFSAPTNLTGTLNWLIGNSYTSAISVKKLAEKIMASDLTFSNIVYVFPAGSTSYQPIVLGNPNAVTVTDTEQIPAMGVFMLRVQKNQGGTIPAGRNFELGKELLMHGNAFNNISSPSPSPAPAPFRVQKSPSNANNQVRFRVSQTNNENIYDLAAIGIRENASLGSDSYDISKITASGSDGFQLYTLSQTGSKLSANGVPTDVETVAMNFKPAISETEFVIEADGAESLTSEAIWLEDLLTGITTNLLEYQTYTFTSYPDDPNERFIVHFKNNQPGVITGTDKINDNKVNIIYANEQFIIRNLESSDLGSKAYLYSADGKIVKAFTVDTYPTMTAPAEFNSGVYILHLQGNRNVSLKAVISNR
ncbi:MAG: hypothetical protein LBN95_10085 [Prevotellaceae bacterium]|jgi:hypothetical protein|nr:hypothetical protein [Prevotellaceae bacterium]